MYELATADALGDAPCMHVTEWWTERWTERWTEQWGRVGEPLLGNSLKQVWASCSNNAALWLGHSLHIISVMRLLSICSLIALVSSSKKKIKKTNPKIKCLEYTGAEEMHSISCYMARTSTLGMIYCYMTSHNEFSIPQCRLFYSAGSNTHYISKHTFNIHVFSSWLVVESSHKMLHIYKAPSENICHINIIHT